MKGFKYKGHKYASSFKFGYLFQQFSLCAFQTPNIFTFSFAIIVADVYGLLNVSMEEVLCCFRYSHYLFFGFLYEISSMNVLLEI